MRCVIAGGGTGGHLFPGMSIAEAFLEKEERNEVLFIGTERGIEARVLRGERFPLKTIQASPIKGKSLWKKLKAIWSTPKAVLEALSILREFRPDLVVGVGGYASGPVLAAASVLGMKRVIHEQNVVPGMTNRILRWVSHKIFVSFEETVGFFPKGKTVVTGNPVRREILNSLLGEKNGGRTEGGDRFTILIFGGSAGAHRINEAMIKALDALEEIKTSVRFIHQTGSADLEVVSKAYREKGFKAMVRPFFEDIGVSYRLADLVVCRAGAGTVSELSICGKTVIFIPYPYAAHNHQFLNARRLVQAGAARMIGEEELSGPALARTILHLYRHPDERTGMGEAIRKFAKPRAAQEIVDHCYALIRRKADSSAPKFHYSRLV